MPVKGITKINLLQQIQSNSAATSSSITETENSKAEN